MVIPSSSDSLPNIVLTGFMGVGKTTVGMRVASSMRRPFVDTDDLIVKRQGKPIAQIFAEEGEPAFRALERSLAQELAQHRGLVIATGGGMLVDPDNRAKLGRSGIIVCLDASAMVIGQRLQGSDGRPLAHNWQQLYAARQQAYAAIEQHVSTDGRSVEEIAEEVIALWQNASR